MSEPGPAVKMIRTVTINPGTERAAPTQQTPGGPGMVVLAVDDEQPALDDLRTC